jgi:predicted TIM-barrel fold metal-dependent hydrolase
MVSVSEPLSLGQPRVPKHPLLPDPSPRDIRLTIISVDDHLVEPPHMFDGRLPRRFQTEAPRVVETTEGHQVWVFDGQVYALPCLGAVAGRPREDWRLEPTRFDEVRPGCYDVHERVRDMDLNGVWASLNFPSQITGFCGAVYGRCSDPALGHAVVEAWNDWFYEEWYSPYPERSIPSGITFLGDAELAAAEIRRNAARGFKAVTFPERPHSLGLPSASSGYWDPVVEACVETDTVLCLHVGSSGMPEEWIAPDAPLLALGGTLFGLMAIVSASEWLWSGYPFRHPTLKIAMSEGGLGWVGMLVDRLDAGVDRSTWADVYDERPSDVLRRNFWFCTIDDPSTIVTKDAIGVENILVETDYPHGDGTWPDSQALMIERYRALDAAELAMVTHENAAALFRHPLPPLGSRHAAGLRRATPVAEMTTR